MSEPVIIFKDVSKSYHTYHHLGGIKRVILDIKSVLRMIKNSSFETLRALSFKVNKGEALGIIGKNGSGKSTTLGLIAGVLRQSGGTVNVTGRTLSVLELGGGFHPELTGRENIILNGVLLGHTKKYVESKREEIIEFSGVREYIDQPLRTYSNGMLARLGFAVVANLDPEILLIDEVLAVGDKDFQKKCIERIQEFKDKGVTIVFVSHRMDEIEKICDRVLWIEDHTIRMDGAPEEVISAYEVS